jgi:hypothetical protein
MFKWPCIVIIFVQITNKMYQVSKILFCHETCRVSWQNNILDTWCILLVICRKICFYSRKYPNIWPTTSVHLLAVNVRPDYTPHSNFTAICSSKYLTNIFSALAGGECKTWLHPPQQFHSDLLTLGLYHVVQFFTGSSWFIGVNGKLQAVRQINSECMKYAQNRVPPVRSFLVSQPLLP